MARRKRKAAARATAATWSDLEQAFFDAAPPDHPEPAAEPACFDDLGAPTVPWWERVGAMWPAIASAGAALRRLVVD